MKNHGSVLNYLLSWVQEMLMVTVRGTKCLDGVECWVLIAKVIRVIEYVL